MNRKSILSSLIILMVGAGAGCVAATMLDSASQSTGVAIASSWETQYRNLVDADGQARSPAAVLEISRINFNSLSIGLAGTIHQLPERERARYQSMVARAARLELSPAGGASTSKVLRCIEAIPAGNTVDETCLAQAVSPR
ncbi:hypothetical protein [Marilutibacter spongiae]|uniref:Lipoprotein n=1 Tax=Marilutibacter spongiae TaxID=2025720 RepID=A0A7W3TPN3_9GAMM|nr:hypothetical protein [Lysobacter spongiae]MBB1062180.1 hypothetical protein [Lysobacter spongiae]